MGESVSKRVFLVTAGLIVVIQLAVMMLVLASGESHGLALRIFGLSLVAVALGLFAAGYLARLLTRPMTRLSEAALRIADGAYGEPIAPASLLEFRPLAHALDSLRRRLATREEESAQRTARDAVTGLPNSSAIDTHLRLAFERAALSGSVVAGMLIDISRTTQNKSDLAGQREELFKELSRKLASNVRVSDTLARTGENQFLVVLEDTDERLAPHLAEFLIDTLSEPLTLSGMRITPKVNIGVVLYPQHCERPNELLRRAEIAAKEAMDAGRPVQVYEPGQDEEHLRQLAIVSDMPNAIRDNDLFLVYQPKVSMATGEVTHVEALVRWKHPQMGYLAPDEFIPLIEHSDRMSALTYWVLREAIAQARSWLDQKLDFGVAINLSANDLLDPGLPERIDFLLHHYLVDPSRVVFEVTESAVVRDVDKAISALISFRQSGIKVSLDDFGTGHSSLALLKKLPIDELKIDKTFVLNLKPGTGDAVIVKSTVDLGHNLGLTVVAEGVENYASWRMLKGYGCDMVQGHMISRALSPDDLHAWYLDLRAKTVNKLDYSFLESA